PPLTHCILLSSVPHLTLHTFPTRRSSDLCFSFQHHSTNSSIDSKCTFISSPPCKILSNPYLVSYRFSAPFPGLVCVDRSQSDCSIVPCSPKILPCRFGYILLTSASPLSVPSLRYLLFSNCL